MFSPLFTDTHIYLSGGKQLSWKPASLHPCGLEMGSSQDLAAFSCFKDVFASGGRTSCVNCRHLTSCFLWAHLTSPWPALFWATSGACSTAFCFLPSSFSSAPATRTAAYMSRALTSLRQPSTPWERKGTRG